MPSFSKMGVFPTGYLRETSQWLLRERRDVVAQIGVLEAELQRIGKVRMYYRTIEGEDGGVKALYQRTGFDVTRGSSLALLMQAYIATGGNPFDICGFLFPDETKVVDTAEGSVVFETYPGGGVVAPESVSYNNPGVEPLATDGSEFPEKTGYEGYEGGYVNSPRYYPRRQGGRLDRGAWDSDSIVRGMHGMRQWANKTIKTRLQNMEWRILKLSDLHEQLVQERDYVLMGAFGGVLKGMPELDEDMYDPRMLVQAIIADFYELLFQTDDAGLPHGFVPNTNTGFLYFTFDSTPEEDAAGMG